MYVIGLLTTALKSCDTAMATETETSLVSFAVLTSRNPSSLPRESEEETLALLSKIIRSRRAFVSKIHSSSALLFIRLMKSFQARI